MVKENKNKDQNGIDTEYDISQHEINEQLVEADSEKASSENIVQKKNLMFIMNTKLFLNLKKPN